MLISHKTSKRPELASVLQPSLLFGRSRSSRQTRKKNFGSSTKSYCFRRFRQLLFFAIVWYYFLLDLRQNQFPLVTDFALQWLGDSYVGTEEEGVRKPHIRRSISIISSPCALTSLPSTWTTCVWNSTPMVALELWSNSCLAKRESRSPWLNLRSRLSWRDTPRKCAETQGRRGRGGHLSCKRKAKLGITMFMWGFSKLTLATKQWIKPKKVATKHH